MALHVPMNVTHDTLKIPFILFNDKLWAACPGTGYKFGILVSFPQKT